MGYFNNKFKYIVLSLFMILFVGCSQTVKEKSNFNSSLEKNSKYISVSTTSDYIENSETEINIYDKDMNILSNQSLSTGGYYYYTEDDSNIYLFGGTSILSINKKSGEAKDFINRVENGLIERANNQGDAILFINNINLVSKNDYDSRVYELENLTDFSVRH